MFHISGEVGAAIGAAAGTAGAVKAFDWSSLIPVVTLVLGFFLKWGQEAFTESRREKRHAVRRSDERKALMEAKRDEAELSDLRAVQPLISEYARGMLQSLEAATARVQAGKGWGVEDDCASYEQSRLARMSMWPINCRLHNREIADRLTKLANLAGDLKNSVDVNEGKSVHDHVVVMTGQVHELVGAEIRRLQDPGKS